MSWIQDNKVPAAILGLTGVGVIGLGVVLFNQWSAASAAQEEFDSVNTSLSNLKSAKIAPTQENLTKKQEIVAGYQKSVTNLSKVLYTLQPAEKAVSNTDFQAKLKARIAEVKKVGGNRLPAEFNLGFDQYVNELPRTDEVASLLSNYLDGSEEIIRLALKSGVISIEMFDRTELPLEKGEPQKPQTGAAKAKPGQPANRGAPPPTAPAVSFTERRQVRLVVKTDQAALQSLLSSLASPSDMPFFTVVRLLRIENEVQEGPARAIIGEAAPLEGEGSDAAPPSDPNAATAPASTDGNAASAPAGDAAATAAPAGPVAVQAAPVDSKVVLGRETLRAYLEIDIVRFLDPQTVQQQATQNR